MKIWNPDKCEYGMVDGGQVANVLDFGHHSKSRPFSPVLNGETQNGVFEVQTIYSGDSKTERHPNSERFDVLI